MYETSPILFDPVYKNGLEVDLVSVRLCWVVLGCVGLLKLD